MNERRPLTKVSGRAVNKDLRPIPDPPETRKRQQIEIPGTNDTTSRSNPTIGTCDVGLMEVISDLLSVYRSKTESSGSVGEALTTTFLADALALSNAWVDCMDWLVNLNDLSVDTVRKNFRVDTKYRNRK